MVSKNNYTMRKYKFYITSNAHYILVYIHVPTCDLGIPYLCNSNLLCETYIQVVGKK